MAEEEENPLVKALPPATDYMTYLTIVDTYLNKDQLPVLHDLLQDERLTTNIGWDLVQLLVPLLPESEQCLQDVACLGNPREVVLKVTELLTEISNEADEISDESEENDEDDEDQQSNKDDGDARYSKQTHRYEVLCARFQSLLHMLCVLHPRIKTRFPSRFLLTSIQSILLAYKSLARFPAATRSVLMFLKSLSGSKRPTLPPRGTEEAVPTVKSLGAAADPEAGDAPENNEKEAQLSMLRALTTQVAKHCIESFEPVEGTSGLAWVERYSEKRDPSKLIPYRQTYRSLFTSNEDLSNRDALVSRLWNIIVVDLSTPLTSLTRLAAPSAHLPDSNTPFSSTPEFPPSNVGALYLLASHEYLALSDHRPLATLPSHPGLLISYLGAPSPTSPGASLVPAALVDSLLLLGWAWLSQGGLYAQPDSEATSGDTGSKQQQQQQQQHTADYDEPFNLYLQGLTLTAATCASSSLRNQAAELSGAVLKSHRNPSARKAFLRDTLEFCPYEGVKACAVGWVKEEFVAALGGGRGRGGGGGGGGSAGKGTEGRTAAKESEVWGQEGGSKTLAELAPLLWPAVGEETEVEELALNVPFYLAGLNSLYLLCLNEGMSKSLGVGNAVKVARVEEVFVGKLRILVDRLLKDDGNVEQGNMKYNGLLMDLMLLDDAVAKSKIGLEKLG